jgi:hypothetical protein
MMAMILVSDDEEFVNCRRRSRCEYLREVFVVVSLAFVSLSGYCDGMHIDPGGIGGEEKKEKEQTP